MGFEVNQLQTAEEKDGERMCNNTDFSFAALLRKLEF